MFSKGKTSKAYFVKSSKRLLIPYVVFLILLSIPEIKGSLTNGGYLNLFVEKLSGGTNLRGIFAAFWFITVLYVASNIFNFMLNKGYVTKIIFAMVLATAYVIMIACPLLPFNLQVVPFALFFIWVGYTLRSFIHEVLQPFIMKLNVWRCMLVAFVVIISFCCVYPFSETLYIDMKYSGYGIPVLSVAIAILMTLELAVVSMMFQRLKPMAKILILAGQASLIIMYLHNFFHIFLSQKIPLLPTIVVFAISLIVPFVLYFLFNRNRYMRMLFIGK